MQLPKELTTVTRLSRYLALSLFIILPFLAFGFGMKYQRIIDATNPMPNKQIQASPSVVIPSSPLKSPY